MTTPKADIGIEPMLLNKQQTAALLGVSQEWFRRHRKALAAQGFPEPDPLIGLYYRRAIIAWLDGRAGLGAISREATAQSEREKEEPI